jgi:hypothetical protein
LQQTYGNGGRKSRRGVLALKGQGRTGG